MDHYKPKVLSTRYEDLGVLGRGGMGEVRRVFDQLLGRTAAMKLMNLERIDESLLSHFIEEAQVSARLQHPNLLPIYDLGRLPDGRYYFTMMVAEGETLRQRIKLLHHREALGELYAGQGSGEVYPLRRLLTAFKLVCDAVAYAHSRGVIHRDIKPQNIIVGDHGAVQLLDWGVAKRLERYYSEWAKEVVGQFQLNLTPINELIEIGSPDSLYRARSERLHKEMASSIYATLDQDLIETLDHPQSYKELRSLPPVHLDDLSSPHEDEQDKLRSHRERTMPQERGEEDLADLARFSVSSEELIGMKLSTISQRSSHNAIAGTLDYMSPEQLRGDLEATSYRSDVYGLGVVLYELLVGHPPFKLSQQEMKLSLQEKLQRGLSLRLEDLSWPADGIAIPDELKALCISALQPDDTLRLSSAEALSQALTDYLDGVGRREKGLEKVSVAEALFERVLHIREEARSLSARGELLSEGFTESDSEEVKRSSWRLLDEAKELNAEAEMLEFQAERTLYDALLFDDQLSEAHTLLALRAQREHRVAEASGQRVEARRQRSIIQSHLPHVRSSEARRLRAYLTEEALVSFEVSAPKASEIRVSAQPYLERDRRLILGETEDWGSGPSVTRNAPLGRYLVTVRADGYETMRYPIIVERERGWSADHPDESSRRPIPLLEVGRLPKGLRYVPEGWFYAGGDPLVSNSVDQKRRLWLSGFAMAERHVTHREYLQFLQALCDRGEEERAYHLRPRLRDEEGEGLYRFASGQVSLIENEFAQLDWPANYTDYESALAYTAWRSEESGLSYRLPADMEWEKVARNVDGRPFPWGDYFDPSFAHMRLSLSTPQPSTPFAWDADQSAWGHYALSGSMRDWTCTTFKTPFPYEHHSVVAAPTEIDISNLSDDRVVRGGSWKTQEGNCRVAFRFVATPVYRDDDGSFRLALSADQLITG